jgi:FMN-dependent oxidoreductase (nitrilotriacetate monooxygenase family)
MTEMNQRMMRLGFLMEGQGYTWNDWRHPKVQSDAMYDFEYFKNQVQTLERGLFDFCFIADNIYTTADAAPIAVSRLEPVTLLSALAAVTRHIGLAGTVSCTYSEPFNVARFFASLDHISGGRAAWNVVTSYLPASGTNFSQAGLPDHDQRYKSAGEHLAVVRGLWDTWEDDAMVQDKASGVFLDKSKVNALNFRGEFYQCKGPINIARPPQGHPVIFQAGDSDVGRTFAARHADGIFSVPVTVEEAREFYDDIKSRAASLGRDPSKILIFPNIRVFVGRTRAEAQEKYRERVELIGIADGLARLSKFCDGFDFTGHDVEAPFPEDVFRQQTRGLVGHVKKIERMVRAEGLTLRQVVQRIAWPSDRFVGSAQDIADLMQHWFETGAGDGFMMVDGRPGDHGDIVDLLVPELQKRGLFRSSYEGTTLRDRLGLARLANPR